MTLPKRFRDRYVPAHIISMIAAPIGFIVIQWAIIDNVVDALMTVAFGEAAMIAEQPKWKAGFRDKVKFAKTAVKRFPALQPFAGQMNELLTEATRISVIRDRVMHAPLSHYEEDGGELRLWFVRRDRAGVRFLPAGQGVEMTIRSEAVTLGELIRAEESTHTLAKRLLDLQGRILEKTVGEGRHE